MQSLKKLRETLAAFGRDRRGNFAMMMAFSAVPLIGAVGLAIDYANMSRIHTELQNALDSAVLAVAQRGDNISDTEARTIAASFLTGNLAHSFTNMHVTRNGTSVTLTAEAPAPLSFGGIFGWNEANIAASSTADMAFAHYEIALVLDTTGSMRGGKLQAMKEAVITLIDDLSSRITDKERLKFALVPFATFVNVGAQFGPDFDSKGKIIPGTGVDWLDLKGVSPIPQTEFLRGLSRFEIAHHLGQDWKGCVETRFSPSTSQSKHDVEDTPAVASDPYSLFVPAFAIDEPSGDWWYSYPNSYISSQAPALGTEPRDMEAKLKKYGLDNAAAEARKGKTNLIGLNVGPEGWSKVSISTYGGRGPSYGCDMDPITPLSNDYADLKSRVNALGANGNTNIMEGVAWGMRVLSPQEPFAQGKDYASDVEKIIIVLTDGSNTFGVQSSRNDFRSAYSSFGYLISDRLTTYRSNSAVTEEMNKKTLDVCENAKREDNGDPDDDVTIYTIRLEEPDVKTGMMLKDCASGPGQFFDSPSRTELTKIFEQIRDGITKLRLSF
ncbi:VWA domain-containing protein [Chelativorans sp. AA-79]|uniref:VWA domain-containing protein n=1 Tax=Chelativorans sp. AA-79 TaxID=3028735 RepID=UPI0023F76579|nr:VWA domain-containing protein [Chelativorans sp. AA-79]WEX11223.1 VWA domain-containing protein [Chelativorans sp. AA-79]